MSGSTFTTTPVLSKSENVAHLKLHAALVFASDDTSVATLLASGDPPATSAGGAVIEVQGDYPELSFVDEANPTAGRLAFVKPHDEAKLHLQGGMIVHGASDTDVRQCGYGTAPALPAPSTTYNSMLMLAPSDGALATIVFGKVPSTAGGAAADTRIAMQISADGRTLTVYGGPIVIDGVDLKAHCA